MALVLVRGGHGFHSQHDLAFVRELERVSDEIREHLAETKRVADEPVGDRRDGVRDEFDVLLDDRRPEGLGDFLEHLPDAEWRFFELQFVGFDLREVQDVVEDAKQVACGRMGDADVLMCLRGEIGFEGQPVHVDDRVHRRADFVAHHREERSLRSIRLHRLFTSRHEVAMRCLLRRHRIVDHAAELPQFAALVTEAGTGVEVAGRHLARSGDDLADLAQEQRLADEPGDQETEERPRQQEADVAAERGVQGGAIGRQSDPERDAGARMLSAKLQRLGNVQALDAVEASKAANALCRVERRRPLSRVLPDVLLQIHRAILDDALTVENGQDGARRKAGTFDEPGHPVEVDARAHDGRQSCRPRSRRDARR